MLLIGTTNWNYLTGSNRLWNSVPYRKNLLSDKPLVKKMVVMIVDALRDDHLSTDQENRMPYAKNAVSKGDAFIYSLRTASPTVTMPRLKVCNVS